MRSKAVTPDDDVLLDDFSGLLPQIFNRIKLEVLDKEDEKEVNDRITKFVMDLSEQEKGLTGNDGTKTTIDIETIFAMLESFLRKYRPELIINDLAYPEKPNPLSFEQHLLLTIKEYEGL